MMIEEERNTEDTSVEDGTTSSFMENVTDGQQQHTPQCEKGELHVVPRDHYKSTAMVKFSQVKPVSQFSKIELHTDLRRPPENWLRSGTQFQAHNTWLKGETNQFSSFNMAGTLPRTVGEVDVISASENIKKLLKIPFSKAQVSMAVHRIGKTLLLDELDLYQHLRTASQSEKNWLKDVIFRAVEDGRHLSTRHKTNETLRSWNLLSKFLHYSIGDTGEESPIPMPGPSGTSATSMPPHSSGATSTNRATALVQHVPDPPHGPETSEFARHVLWEFEDLRMLIGSDLPIFGGGKYPAVSLRLRDMNSPINVLTGMDYWLDNLMCNVPEIAMCYHLNGIVKRYELLKTEEIPHVENAQFSPRVVIDIAQNILSYIKSSCTKEGHTYWLYKGQNDDVVKLYDLTSLSMEPHGRTEANPFVKPVALLLYRVAHAMSSSQPTKKDKGIICKLLKNCLTLLERDGDRNPELLASANCLLSHMLVSDDDLKPTPEGSPESKSDDEFSGEEEDEEGSEDESVSQLTTIEVDRLTLPTNEGKGGSDSKAVVPKILWDTKVERAQAALAYIVKGLRCIDYSSSDSTDDHDLESDATVHVGSPSRQLCYTNSPFTVEEHSSRDKRNPSTELVSYSSRRRSSSQLQRSGSDSDGSGDKHQEDSSFSSSTPEDMAVAHMDHPPGSWQFQSKTLLLRKARQIYSILAVGAQDARRYGKGLHYAKMAFACHYAFEALQKQKPTTTTTSTDKANPLSEILQACGDCHLLLTHNLPDFQHHKGEYNHESDDDAYIMQTTRKESASIEYNWACSLHENVDSSLETSIQSYMEALNKAKEYDNEYQRGVGRKLGNAYNEQGVYYRNVALEMAKEEVQTPSTEEQELWKKSYQSFESGLLAFEEVNDPANIALLYCNLGQLMRVCAHAYAAYNNGENGGEFTHQEKHYYNQATDYYHKALCKIEQRRKHKALWDSVSWELSTTYFTMATLLQDHPPLSRMAHEQVEKVVLEAMTKALTPCEMEGISPDRQPIYQYRAATIHHRLASMYHNSYRNQLSQQKQKHTRSLAELHYDKAIKLFQDLDHPTELLRVQLEKVALYEHIFQGQNGVGSRIKSLQSALDELLHCQDTVSAISKNESSNTDTDADGTEKKSQDGGNSSKMEQESETLKQYNQDSAMNLEKREASTTSHVCNQSKINNLSSAKFKVQKDVQLQTRSQDTDVSVPVRTSEKIASTSTSSSPPSSSVASGVDGDNQPTNTDNLEHERRKHDVKGKDHSRQNEGRTSPSKAPSHESPTQDTEGKTRLTKEAEERNRLQSILRSRLQFILLNLIKLHGGTKKASQQLINLKKMYALSLSQPTSSTPDTNQHGASSTSSNLASILQQIKSLHT
ncbi:erythroid differentiation-related factor 1-like [Amphiura filiformis]|uniref:erythroid differentiation-related factor 1-like n=1 Tax=Amphiura filiformis TaxID=82378 RepID=UPI003B20D140